MSENIKPFVRSTEATPEELDAILCQIQSDGRTITNIIPCPRSIDVNQTEINKLVGGVEMILLVIHTA